MNGGTTADGDDGRSVAAEPGRRQGTVALTVRDGHGPPAAADLPWREAARLAEALVQRRQRSRDASRRRAAATGEWSAHAAACPSGALATIS